jgi:hypothetical protein
MINKISYAFIGYVIIIVTFTLGAIFGHTCIKTLEQMNMDTWRGNSKEGILIYVGYDPSLGRKWQSNSVMTVYPNEDSKWQDHVVVRFKSKEEAIEARNRVLKAARYE